MLMRRGRSSPCRDLRERAGPGSREARGRDPWRGSYKANLALPLHALVLTQLSSSLGASLSCLNNGGCYLTVSSDPSDPPTSNTCVTIRTSTDEL